MERVFRCRHGRFVEGYEADRLADHATRQTAEALRIDRGAVAADVGCGSGMLALCCTAAGAAKVYATDVDPACCELTRNNARRNGVGDRVEVLQGSVLDGVPTPLDCVVALVPQKPGPAGFHLRYAGGEDGTGVLRAAIRQSRERLRPGGVLWLWNHTLNNTPRVEAELDRGFSWAEVSRRWRSFRPEALERLGIGDHVRRQPVLVESRLGRPGFFCRVLRAVRR